ncbi:hypothetical protein BC833DRAFT_145102 [Globomyces pollinis-pini]|nr:hypothetical protein BC833DRAFT_145102 [Globomyces pollinis-pini]
MIATLIRLSNLIYVCIITISILQKPISLFSLHPLCMILAWSTICEGILSYSLKHEKNKLEKFKIRVNRHQIFMVLSTVLILIGFSIIYQVKENSLSEHFTTNHGYYGALISTIVILQGFGALIVFNTYHLASKLFWTLHGTFTIFAIVGVWLITWLHLYTTDSWFVGFVKFGMVWNQFGVFSFLCSGILLLSTLVVFGSNKI